MKYIEYKKISRWQRIRKPLGVVGIIAACVLVIGLIVAVIGGYHSDWDWTGIGKEESKTTKTWITPGATTVTPVITVATETQPAKTVWDWLGLLGVLAIPVVVGLGAAWFTAQQGKVSERENEDNQREKALQDYIDKMSELLLKKHLGELTDEHLRELKAEGKFKPEYEQVRNIARVRTITVIFQLDARRIGLVFTFLREVGLNSNKPNSNIVSFENANLKKIDLSQAKLSGANLSHANLSNADLSHADLSHANLSHSSLILTYFDHANLSQALLPLADLSLVNLSDAYLVEADLNFANLSQAHLKGADLSRAELRKADLSGANLSNANLSEADLSGANLSNANLSEADLSGANLYKAKVIQKQLNQAKSLKFATMPDGKMYSNYSGANFAGESMSFIDLSGFDLSGADLSGTDLTSANLHNANLSNAILFNADLRNADLEGANLYKAWVTKEQLTKAKSLQGATMPDGSKHP